MGNKRYLENGAIERRLQLTTNRKSRMAYQMLQIPVTFSESEGHFCCYDWQNASRGPST